MLFPTNARHRVDAAHSSSSRAVPEPLSTCGSSLVVRCARYRARLKRIRAPTRSSGGARRSHRRRVEAIGAAVSVVIPGSPCCIGPTMRSS